METLKKIADSIFTPIEAYFIGKDYFSLRTKLNRGRVTEPAKKKKTKPFNVIVLAIEKIDHMN